MFSNQCVNSGVIKKLPDWKVCKIYPNKQHINILTSDSRWADTRHVTFIPPAGVFPCLVVRCEPVMSICVMFKAILLINRQHFFWSAEEDMGKEPSFTSCTSSLFLSCSLLPIKSKSEVFSLSHLRYIWTDWPVHSRRSTRANKFSKLQIKTTCQLLKKYYVNYCHIILSRRKCVCWQELINFLFWTPMSWKWIDASVLVMLSSARLKSKAKCFPVSQ